MNAYTVQVEPQEGWWRVTLVELGIVSQTCAANRAAALARDLIVTALGVPADSFELHVVAYLPL